MPLPPHHERRTSIIAELVLLVVLSNFVVGALGREPGVESSCGDELSDVAHQAPAGTTEVGACPGFPEGPAVPWGQASRRNTDYSYRTGRSREMSEQRSRLRLQVSRSALW